MTARSRTIRPLFPLVTGLDTAQEAAGWSSGLKGGRSYAVSRPISVEGVGDKDADAKNYKNCCNKFKHGAALTQ